MIRRTTEIVAFIVAIITGSTFSHASDIQPVPMRSLDRPYEVRLGVNKVTAFTMPGPIDSTRIPPAAIDFFVVEADPGSNILWVSPKREILESVKNASSVAMPITLFIVTGGIPYEFAVTVTDGPDYRHQVLVAESPLEVSKRNEVQAVQKRFESERQALLQSVHSLMKTLTKEKKFKAAGRTVYTEGKLYVRLLGQTDSSFLLQTNIPQAAFSMEQKAVFLDSYVLTKSKKFSVLGKEVKL